MASKAAIGSAGQRELATRVEGRSRLFLGMSALLLLMILLTGVMPEIGYAEDVPETSRDLGPASEAANSGEKRVGPARFHDPEDGHLDLSYFLENPRGFLPIPIVITEPAVGYGAGVIAMFLRPREEAGGEGWARPNIAAVGALATENGTRAAFAGDSSRWLDGRLKTLVGGGGGKINLDFYGLGPASASLDEAVRYSLDFSLALVQGNWQLRPKSPWAVGLRYVCAQVEPKLRDTPLFPGLADHIDVKVSAPAGILEFDSRDNLFTPTRGIYAESSILVSRENLGASDDFERFQQVLMGWYPITDDVTLGLRGDYQWSSEGTPFFLRPYIKLRGVTAMRYQGDEMASVEVEARWQFRPRWSAVAIAGGGTARTSRASFSDRKNVSSGGIGFRYELARKFGLHAGLDVAFSSETTAVYIQVGNAWFRP